MISVARRTAILGFARLTNQFLGFLSPLFMVRLLTIEQYGQYRDLLLYATILFPWIQLSINNSLTYFIPKEPQNEKLYLSQATYFVFFSSAIVVSLLLLFRDYLPSETVRSYIYPLCLYIAFFTNLDAWEVYWLAKKQVLNVFIYSSIRFGIRTAVVVGVTFLTRRVEAIIWTMAAFEAARLLIVMLYGLRNNLFTSQLKFDAAKRQLAFSLPIGASVVLYGINYYLGQFFVSIWLGAAALAIYSIGTYLRPIVHIFRNSIADVIMPEIVSRRDVPPNIALRLWQRATMIYCAVMLPLALLLFYYADVVVATLFTSAYVDSIPIFQIYTFILVRECFDFSVPLRTVNRTGVFFVGGIIGLVVNVSTMLALFDWLGILAPAIALMVTRFVGFVYLAICAIKYCEFSLANFLPWLDIAKIIVACLICMPVMLAGDLFDMAPLLRAVIFGAIWVCLYATLLRMAGIPEITAAVERLWLRVTLRSRVNK